MSDPTELGDRIARAMGRIEGALADATPSGTYSEADMDAARSEARAEAEARAAEAETELERLREALEAEQTAGVQLRERIDAMKAQKEADAAKLAALESEMSRLRAARADDRAELDDLIAALKPLVQEAG